MRGSSSRSGPPPDPNALRRDRKDDAGWTHLPSVGRQGDAPPWPLTRPKARERVLWENEWKRPQAVMWEANEQQLQVALYVRCLAEAEKPNAATPLRTLVKQQEEILGISLAGLRANRWIIAELEDKPVRQPKLVEGGTSIRERLKDVGGA